MNARATPEMQARPMRTRDLDAVMAIETGVYGFPWTRGNFVDSLAAGYRCEVLVEPAGALVGYCIAMAGVGELHLLNLTVAPAWQGRGLAREMLDGLEAHGRGNGFATLWLEVRESNQRARALYRRRGFAEVGLRRGYYPAPHSTREDAVVMSLRLLAGPGDGVD